jgi:hypothetical protein
MNNVLIEYEARKITKAFKPCVFVNGKWVYTISHSKKTMRGGLAEAKRLAESIAKNNYPACWNNVTVKEKDS